MTLGKFISLITPSRWKRNNRRKDYLEANVIREDVYSGLTTDIHLSTFAGKQ